MPAIKVRVCVLLPMRMVLDSPATPGLPISILYIARGEITAGEIAQGDVDAAGSVVKEGASTDGRVVVAGGVV